MSIDVKTAIRGTALVGAAALLLAAPAAYAQTADGLNRAVADIGGDGRPLSLSLQILVLMSLLTVLPSLLLMMTSFTRIIIVLSILRHALGLQQTPPNQVLVGLSLFLSLFIMQPVISEVNRVAIEPYGQEQIDIGEAVTRSGDALHGFMMKQTRKTDLMMFAKLCQSRRRALFDPASGVRDERTQDRIPDRLSDIPAFPRHRPDRRVGADVARHDDAVADDYLDALQAAALRPRRRLGADDGVARLLLYRIARWKRIIS
jgi:hypothetical protein